MDSTQEATTTSADVTTTTTTRTRRDETRFLSIQYARPSLQLYLRDTEFRKHVLNIDLLKLHGEQVWHIIKKSYWKLTPHAKSALACMVQLWRFEYGVREDDDEDEEEDDTVSIYSPNDSSARYHKLPEVYYTGHTPRYSQEFLAHQFYYFCAANCDRKFVRGEVHRQPQRYSDAKMTGALQDSIMEFFNANSMPRLFMYEADPFRPYEAGYVKSCVCQQLATTGCCIPLLSD